MVPRLVPKRKTFAPTYGFLVLLSFIVPVIMEDWEIPIFIKVRKVKNFTVDLKR